MKIKFNEKKSKETDRYFLNDTYLSPQFTFSRTVLKPGQSTRGHLHNETDEIYYFKDTPRNVFLQITEKKMEVDKDDFHFIRAGEFHKVINNSKSQVVFYCIFKPYKRPE